MGPITRNKSPSTHSRNKKEKKKRADSATSRLATFLPHLRRSGTAGGGAAMDAPPPATPHRTSSSSSASPSPSPHLNLPPSYSRSPLLLDTRRHHPCRLGSGPSPAGTTVYSDRFIPSRASSNFAFFDLPSSPSPSAAGGGGDGDHREDAASTYSALLKSVLFGPSTPDNSPADGRRRYSPLSASPSSSGTPPNRNIFRFKTEISRPSYAFSAADFDGPLPGVVPSPPKTPRKVARTPYKVNCSSFCRGVGQRWVLCFSCC